MNHQNQFTHLFAFIRSATDGASRFGSGPKRTRTRHKACKVLRWPVTVTVRRLVTQRAWRFYTNAMGWQSGSSGYNSHTGPCIFYRHGPFPTIHKDLIIKIHTTYIHWSYVIISYHIINAFKYWNLNLDSSIDSVNLNRFEALHPISRNFSQTKTVLWNTEIKQRFPP